MSTVEIASFILFGVSELLPFLPVKGNGLLQFVVQFLTWLVSSQTNVPGVLPNATLAAQNTIKNAIQREMALGNHFVTLGEVKQSVLEGFTELGYDIQHVDGKIIIKW